MLLTRILSRTFYKLMRIIGKTFAFDRRYLKPLFDTPFGVNHQTQEREISCQETRNIALSYTVKFILIL